MNTYVAKPQPVRPFTPQQTRGAMNTQVAEAQASADQRYNMKPMDRAGFSRGGAQQYMAGISAAQNLADGIAKAYGTQASDAAANATTTRDAEALGQDMTGLAMQARYADLLSRLQRQSLAQESALGGLMGQDLNAFLGF
jgi:hypothetical protein